VADGAIGVVVLFVLRASAITWPTTILPGWQQVIKGLRRTCFRHTAAPHGLSRSSAVGQLLSKADYNVEPVADAAHWRVDSSS